MHKTGTNGLESDLAPAKEAPVVLTSGPGITLSLADILAVARGGRRVALEPSPAFSAHIAAGHAALERMLTAGVRAGSACMPALGSSRA